MISPIQRTSVVVPTDGVIQSNRFSTKPTPEEEQSHTIRFGIHCYSRQDVYRCTSKVMLNVYRCTSKEIMLTLKVDAADFVACDGMGVHCVFSKVTVNPLEVSEKISQLNLDDDEDEEDEDDEDDYDDDDYEDEEWDDDDDDDDDDEWDE